MGGPHLVISELYTGRMDPRIGSSRIGSDRVESFFSQRIIVSEWNKLPEEVVAAETVNAFKNRLDKWRKG